MFRRTLLLLLLAPTLLALTISPSFVDNDIAAASAEPCPNDSIAVDGICKCNPESCQKPPCRWLLQVVKEGNSVPGDCCPQYTCDGCSETDKIDGKCPCAPNATLNSSGRDCECINPHESLTENNECKCDVKKCEMRALCDERSVDVKNYDGCCYKTECKTCPPDSYPTAYNSDQIENMCVCFKCKEAECSENQIAVIKKRGVGTPGRCCDQYDCKNALMCLYDNKTYSDGDVWFNAETKCTCHSGISKCIKSDNNMVGRRPCLIESDSRSFNHNESWLEDSCTNCTCIDGKATCIANLCQLNIGTVTNKTMPDGNQKNKCDNRGNEDVYYIAIIVALSVTLTALLIYLFIKRRMAPHSYTPVIKEKHDNNNITTQYYIPISEKIGLN